MRRLALGLPIIALLLGRAAAQPAPAAEPPRPFQRGSMNLGVALALAAGGDLSVTLGADFGYFVLAGLEPGLDVEVTFADQRSTVASLLPYLRWIVWRSYVLSPYLKVQGGRWFILGEDDVSPVGGGGGLIYFLTRTLALQLEGMVFRLFPCVAGQCMATSVGLSLGFYFGGPAARPAPAPVPPTSRGVDEPGVAPH